MKGAAHAKGGEAIRYLTEGRAQGKLLVTISKDAQPAAARAEQADEPEHE